MKESKRISRWVDLEDYDHTAKGDDFLEVTEWCNGEGFDLHISRGEQIISLTWGEFAAMQKVLDDWIDQPDAKCPHIITSDEGTSYCKLAEKTADLLTRLKS
jgi:hypothetical protein